MLVVGLLAAGVGTASAAFAQHLWQLYVGLGLLLGFGGVALGAVPSSIIIGRWFPAQRLGVPHLHQIYYEGDHAPDMSEASTEALILSPTEAGLADFRRDPRWNAVGETSAMRHMSFHSSTSASSFRR